MTMVLNQELKSKQEQIEKLKKEIKEIQDNCSHTGTYAVKERNQAGMFAKTTTTSTICHECGKVVEEHTC